MIPIRWTTRRSAPMRRAMSRSGRRSAPMPSTSPTTGRRPIDHAHAPAVRVAENVAATIAGWIGSGEIIEGRGSRLRPGDVLVLVRKRDRFVHALTRALKRRDIPVAGADRLSLPGHIAVKDLIALGHFLIQPQDDLSLAAVLRSPIFDVSEETLFTLAGERPAGLSLIASLQTACRRKCRAGCRRHPARQLGQRGGLQAGVRILCRRAGARRPAQEDDRAARTGGRRHPRRVPELLPGRGADRPAGAGILPVDAGKCRPRDQARDGPDPRRGSRHDRACRQGPGSAGGVPGRWRFGAVQRPASAATDAVRRLGQILGRQGLSLALGQRRRQRLFEGRFGPGARSRRRRIPPAALCRHDAGRGPADRLRLPRQAGAEHRHLAFDRQPRAGRRTRKRGAPAPRHRRAGASLPRDKAAADGAGGRRGRRGRRNSSRHCRRPCSGPCRLTRICRARCRRPAPRR